MRIGMVCPYSFDVPGGVQFHVRDLAEHFRAQGHDVLVLAPSEEDESHPAWFTSCGRPVAVPYNGSVARLTFGPVTSARVGRWVDEGDFDLLHIHEPVTPSASVLALWAARLPVVATFHTSTLRSRAMHAANPLLRPSMEKINARIAVSEAARQTVLTHLKADAYVIPNGVDVAAFGSARRDPRFVGRPGRRTVAFLGRIDESRKGLAILLAALAELDTSGSEVPHLFVAGPGDVAEAADSVPAALTDRVEFLGLVSEPDKAALLASVDAYIAPHTGGESFGIVLIEAMAAGAPVIASDLEAFCSVLGDTGAGVTFPVSEPAGLAERLREVLGDDDLRARMSRAGRERAGDFDWESVAARIMAVYETVVEGVEAAPRAAESTGIVARVRRRAHKLGLGGGDT
ncbi:glycosyltransferase family 4 protein [Phycicoccus elongatus]|uniref:glycosyltransferase family 4 protein n=1 Tax=Phycicoccus elongatus TaxID=101689 RepID=UPI002C5B2B5E|nr:glycosyltransferase family 4 protein [Phycicoccus elongatus]HPQ73626.1 glycosyltransferase family 4 protein [Phycicoccus elongatus]